MWVQVPPPAPVFDPAASAHPPRQVISASRRTDIPRWYPRWLGAALRAGEVTVVLPYGAKRVVSLKPEAVHTLVLWSKDYSHLLADPWVREFLANYDHVFCHFTVTGLGGSPIEPGAPPWEVGIAQLPELVELCGSPHRVVVRFDPVVHWREGSHIRSNLAWAEPIFRGCARNEVREIRTSFATLYGKVRRRGWEPYDPPPEEKHTIAVKLRELASSLGLTLSACSDPILEEAGIPGAPCIEGRLLAALHPAGERASTRRDRGQRPSCACTESVDIGSYAMSCPEGCLYCYANPRLLAPGWARPVSA